MSPGDAQDFLRAFWKSLDPTPTTLVNERLVEHYRRVTMADVLYANPRLDLRGESGGQQRPGDAHQRCAPRDREHSDRDRQQGDDQNQQREIVSEDA